MVFAWNIYINQQTHLGLKAMHHGVIMKWLTPILGKFMFFWFLFFLHSYTKNHHTTKYIGNVHLFILLLC